MKSPILEAINSYIEKDNYPFHTPGHKGSWFIPGFETIHKLAKADVADDIGNFPEALYKSEKEAAKVYNSKRTFYLVNGSTAGVHAMFLSVLKPGDKVILGRNIHFSVVFALIMTGAVPVYIPIEFDKRGLPLNVHPQKAIDIINKNSDAKAIFITSPSYTGISVDLTQIAQKAHQHNMLVLVDEAWGAHFPFFKGPMKSALSMDCDLVVHGAHKTLPTLTGTSLLHVNSERISIEKIEKSLRMVETTSPNTLFYMSLENAIKIMKEEGEFLIKKAKNSVGTVYRNLKENTLFRYNFPDDLNIDNQIFKVDPCKLLLRTNYEDTGLSGYEIAEFISQKHRIMAEMSDLRTVLFIFTGFEEEGMEGFLSYVIRHASMKFSRCKREAEKSEYLLENISFPEISMIPRSAFFAKEEIIPLNMSAGEIAQDSIVPYPPGIPQLIPGEKITPEKINYIEKVISLGGDVKGVLFNDKIPWIKVIK